ncbi:MAG: hypothetical protein ACRD1L_06230 [Terriglobales bacterium]
MALGCLVVAMAPASASELNTMTTTITWNLDGVKFVAGGSATGFVTVQITEIENRDEDDEEMVKTLTDWDVTIAGIPTIPGTSFTPGNSKATITGDPIFDLLQNDPNQFNFTTPFLPELGGTVTIGSGFFNDPGLNFTTDIVPGGSLISVPEPAPWTLVGAGMLLLGLALRRRTAMS